MRLTRNQERERAVTTLPKLGRLAVCAACSQRLIGYYEAYSRRRGRPSPSVASAALDFVWAAAAGQHLREEQASILSKEVEALLPEGADDDSPHFLAFYGLLAVALALRAYTSDSVEDCAACLEQG